MLVKKVYMKEGKYVLRIACSFLNGEQVVTEIAAFPGDFSFHLRDNFIDSKFTGILAFLPVLIATKVSALKRI